MRRDTVAASTDPTPLRIVWFGHAAGRRADGLSSYSCAVVRELFRRGLEVHFVAHDVDGDQAPVGDATFLRGMRLRTLTLSLPGSRAQIARLLADSNPDVVHVSWSFSNLDAAIGKLAHTVGAVAVATFHLPYASPRSARGQVLRQLYRYHVRALANYDCCIALSQTQADLLVASGYPRERIEVVHNGVDTATITPGPSRWRDAAGASFVVLYMGRLDPEKRVTALIRCFLEMGWPDDHLLVIAGSGTQEARVRRLVGDRPNVRLLGLVTDEEERLDLLRGADVFVLPSTAEGLSLSMLEAMAAGCAVVATDAGEDGAALGDAGIRLPVRPLRPHLVEALRRLHDDPDLRARLGAAARQRVVDRYDLRSNVDRLLAIDHSLLTAAMAAA